MVRYAEQEESLTADVKEMATGVRSLASKAAAQLAQARILTDRLEGEMGDEGRHRTSLLQDPACPVLLAPDDALDASGLTLDRGTLNLLSKSLARGDTNSDLTRLIQLCDALTPPSTGSTTPPAQAQRLLQGLAESLEEDPGQCYASLLRAGAELTHCTDTGEVLGEAARLLKQLRASDTTVKGYLDIASAQRALCTSAKQNGRFGEADQRLADLCAALHELFTLGLERCSVLGDPAELDSRSEGAAKTAHQTFGHELAAVDANTNTLRTNIAADKEHIVQRREHARSEHDTAMAVLDTESGGIQASLQTNEAEQQHIHEQIVALVAQLEQKQEVRRGDVEALVKVETEKVKSRRLLDAKNAILEEHDTKLHGLQQSVDALEGVCGEMSKLADVRLDVFRRELEASRERIGLADTEEKKAAYEHYSELYRQLNERLFTGERRVEELTAAVEAAEWRASISGTTLDHAGATGVSSNTTVHINTLRESMHTVSKVTRSIEDVIKEAQPLHESLVQTLGEKAPVPPERTFPQELAERKLLLEKKRKESIQRIAENVRCNITSANVGAEPGCGEPVSQRRKQQYAERIRHQPQSPAHQPVNAYTGSPQRLESARHEAATPPVGVGVAAASPAAALSPPALPPRYDVTSPLQPPTPLAVGERADPVVQEAASPSPMPPAYATPSASSANASPAQLSPALTSPNVALPSTCDELRKRAELLRKAAVESRRRAQAHRDQASSISPRRPLYEDLP